MSDNPIPEFESTPNPIEGKLSEELGALGRNLIDILRVAWERPERQKLQDEIESGLVELSSTLRKEAKAVSESPVTQRVKSEVEDLGNRVRNGQIDVKVREELIGALHVVNAELIKVADHLATPPKYNPPAPADGTTDGEPPFPSAPPDVAAQPPVVDRIDNTIPPVEQAKPDQPPAEEA